MSKAVKILVLAMEPAGYTLALAREVLVPLGAQVAFVKGTSPVGKDSDREGVASWGFFRRWGWYRRVLREFDAVVVNSYVDRCCVELLAARLLFGGRCQVAVNADSPLKIPRGFFKRWLKARWLGFWFGRPWAWGFACGTGSHMDFYRHYGLAERRLQHMPLVVDTRDYLALTRTESGPGRLRLGFVGRLVDCKNLPVLLRAMAKTEDGCTLTVVGDGPERARLERLAETLGIGGRVRFLGMRFGAEKLAALREMDALALVSSSEAWGLAVNEALASGLPVVVSEAVGCRQDLVEADPPAGLVVKTGDVDDLAATIGRLANDVELRRTLGENGRRRMRGWDYELYRRCWRRWADSFAI